MKIYLCGRYSRRDQLRALREELRRRGHAVTSGWLDTEWERKDDTGGSSAAPTEYRREHAVKDLADVATADVLVAFTEEPRSGGRGGRHVEMGYALGLGKAVVVVGPFENVFCHHPAVTRFESHWDWLRALNGEGPRLTAGDMARLDDGRG